MFSRSAAFSLLSVLLISCRPAEPPAGVARVAVLPFENLSGDESIDWMSQAVASVVAWQLASSPDVSALSAPSVVAARDQGAARLLRGTLEREKGGQVRLDAWIEDLKTNRQVALDSYRVRPDQTLLDACSRIATGLGGKVRPYATRSADAVRALMQARSLADPVAARERYQAALASDPGFSTAYLALAEFEAAQGDRDAAAEVLAAFPATAEAREKAEASLLASRLKNDPAASALALKELAAASPTDAALQRTAASTFEQLGWPRETADAWQRLLRLEPDQPDALRGLAYAKSWLNEMPAARELLARYRQVAPQDLNTLDSLAEIEYQAGRFEEAAKVFEQMSRSKPTSPQSIQFIAAGWTKAAYARLMLGDEKAANVLFEKGLAARNLTGPSADVQRASWLFQTGHRQQAFSLLNGASEASRPFAAQSCLLHAAAGDWSKAREALQRNVSSAAGLFCAFVSQPEASEAEWRTRAERQLAGPQLATLRQRLLGYALALRGHYAAAVAPLRASLYDSSPENFEVRLLLGRCYYELKQWPQMREVLTPWPVPPTLQPLFNPLFFPAQLELRAKTELHYERAAEAKRWLDLYQRYSQR